nr:MAG TPA: restriction endonuclease [Caudoviricetes sp.]DAS08435.1 MAG TPA: restriction endonuclease [Caudoviricetes sp.]
MTLGQFRCTPITGRSSDHLSSLSYIRVGPGFFFCH